MQEWRLPDRDAGRAHLARCRAEVERAHKQMAADKTEIEWLLWNLAGCDTIAMGYHSGDDFSKDMARPALHSVARLAAERDALKQEVERLTKARNLDVEAMDLYNTQVADLRAKLAASEARQADAQAAIRGGLEREDVLKAQLAAAQADTERLIWEAHLALGVLANMAEERETNGNPFESRWPIHHEGLRKDAQFVVPRLRAAIDAARREGGAK